MGGHHGPKPPKIPDWRMYKVEDVPDLVRLRQCLHSVGLKNPWLRNEVWAFQAIKEELIMKTLVRTVFSGFKIGLGAAILTTILEKTYFSVVRGDEHGHEKH